MYNSVNKILYLATRLVNNEYKLTKTDNILSNKCTRAIGKSKPARTSPYDSTESSDTTSS